MDKYNGKLCRPRTKNLYSLGSGWNAVTIALSPTQRWTIQNRVNHKWAIKRHNVVLWLTDDEFIDLFYRTDR